MIRSPDLEIRFEAEIIRFDGAGAWHAVFLPAEAAAKARFFGQSNALGAISVMAQIGKTSVRTSLFPDKKRQTYMLPLKASLRQAEKIAEGDTCSVCLSLIT